MSDDENIFLFVPNLIGFGRVVLGVASLFYMESDPLPAMVRRMVLLINALQFMNVICLNTLCFRSIFMLLLLSRAIPASNETHWYRRCTGRLLSLMPSTAMLPALSARV